MATNNSFNGFLGRAKWIWYLLILLGPAAWLYAWYYPSVFDEALYFVGSAAFSSAMLTVWGRRILSYDLQDRVTESLAIAFSKGDTGQGLFDQISDEAKAQVVKNALGSALEPSYGAAVYNHVVSPYMKDNRSFREGVNYTVRCEDNLSISGGDYQAIAPILDRLHLTAANYMWLYQDLSYTENGFRDGQEARENLTVIFALSEAALQQFLDKDGLFFREILHVDDDFSSLVAGLDRSSLEEFARIILEFKAFNAATGSPLQFDVELKTLDVVGEKYICIQIENPSRKKAGAGCRITFRLPHGRESQYFLVTLPKPTSPKATISFQKAPSMSSLASQCTMSGKIDDAYKLTYSPDAKQPDKIDLVTEKWMFPTSSIVFVWSYAAANRVS